MTAPIAPVTDEDSTPYWTGLRDHRLVLQRCARCARHRFPAMPSCPYCSALEWSAEEVAAAGEIFSWIVVHHAFAAAFRTQVPYVVTTIQLDCGARVPARFECGEPSFGLRVAGFFVDHDGWTELRFAPQQKPLGQGAP